MATGQFKIFSCGHRCKSSLDKSLLVKHNRAYNNFKLLQELDEEI